MWGIINPPSIWITVPVIKSQVIIYSAAWATCKGFPKDLRGVDWRTIFDKNRSFIYKNHLDVIKA